jgi:hypothetical protein
VADTNDIEWFRWIVGLAVTCLTAVAALFWRRIDEQDKDIAEKERQIDDLRDSIDGKLDRIMGRITEHELSDERTFVRKDELREVMREVHRRLDELIAREDRNFQIMNARFDRLEERGKD